ncbi:zinc finger C2HC domain-containing protein 1C-like [Trichomycterus rosablanca]|uniref:zinc finger C2HC domain-containing protein 1C-like n=1 Tax=Trichomycterus rosablanca TaxID=2290929 RepID=UPI002F35BD25
MDEIITELLLLQKIKRLQDEFRRLNYVLQGPAASGKENIRCRASKIPVSLGSIEKKRLERERKKNASTKEQNLRSEKRQSQIPLPLAVIEKRRAESLQHLPHAPKPPNNPQMFEKSFRQKRAERLRAENITNYPEQELPLQTGRVTLRPLQLKKSSDETSNIKLTPYDPLPPIDSGEGLNRPKKVKYNYLGKFERKPVKKVENFSPKKKVLEKKEEDCGTKKQQKQKYNYLGRFNKEENNEEAEMNASGSSDETPEQQVRKSIRHPRLASHSLPECMYCGRRFAQNRLDTHTDICSRLQQKKRPVFNSSKQRKKGTRLEGYISTDDRAEFKMTKSKNTADFVTCPHCFSRMAPRIAQIHIAKCSTTREHQE